MSATWHLALFGRIRVTVDGRTIDEFVTRRSGLLLARLALAHGRSLTRSAAAESLWPGDYFDATRVRLRQELSRLRKALGPASEVLAIEGEFIRLAPEVAVDVDEFRTALRDAAAIENPVRKFDALEQAVEIGASPLLADADEPWVKAERDQLNRDAYHAMLDLSTLARARGEFEAALKYARLASSLLPERDESRLLAVQVLSDMGHAADAMLELGGIRGGHVPKLRRFGQPRAATSPQASSRPLRYASPFAPEPIYGREEELAEICHRLEPTPGRTRLLSLLGPGGIGKSRLLVEAATLLAPMYAGRVAYVDLSELHDARLVPLAVLRALRADSIPTENPAERLSSVLPAEPVLLVLDNLEQLGARMQVLVRRLLERHSELRIIVASRNALGASGERRVQIEPLPVSIDGHETNEPDASPALQMFVGLAHAHGLKHLDLGAAASIVRRLEGVPLAIVLAAGRLRTLGVDGLTAELDASFDILSTSRTSVPERHRSIRHAVEDSFNVLPPALRNALAALAVFRGGWTLEASTRVCGLTSPLEDMEALLDASLIYVAQEARRVRFRMLESIRSYALVQLDDDTADGLLAAHAEWIAELSESTCVEFPTADDIRRLDAIDSEADNLRAALAYALDRDPELAFRLGAALTFFWRYRSNGFEARQFYEDLFDRYLDLATTPAAARAAYGQVVILEMVAESSGEAELARAIRLCDAAGLADCGAKLHVIKGTRDQHDQNGEGSRDHFFAAERLLVNHGSRHSLRKRHRR